MGTADFDDLLNEILSDDEGPATSASTKRAPTYTSTSNPTSNPSATSFSNNSNPTYSNVDTSLSANTPVVNTGYTSGNYGSGSTFKDVGKSKDDDDIDDVLGDVKIEP